MDYLILSDRERSGGQQHFGIQIPVISLALRTMVTKNYLKASDNLNKVKLNRARCRFPIYYDYFSHFRFRSTSDPHRSPTWHHLALSTQWYTVGGQDNCRPAESRGLLHTHRGQVASGILQERIHTNLPRL